LLDLSMAGYNDVFNQNATEQQQRASKVNDIWGSSAAVASSLMK
jgi:hypothetical protein